MDDRPTNEHILDLGEGRVLAYADGGVPTSNEVVIFFHGAFGVGAMSRIAPILEERRVHSITPTLPGWGESSAAPTYMPFCTYLYRIMTTLITTLHPDTSNLRLYIAGGSFGTVIAQILYGAPYDQFPLGRHIVGMLLLAPFSPPFVHKEFSQCLSFANYLMVGAPGRLLPFKLIPRLGKLMMKGKTDTREHAEQFLREFAFNKMTPEERAACEKWKVERGLKDGEEVKEMADGVYRSVKHSWAGFFAIPDIIQSDWGGYSPALLDDEHSKPVLLVLTHGDVETKKMGEWLGANLKNASIRYEAGGHIGSLFVMDSIWEDFMSRIPPVSSVASG